MALDKGCFSNAQNQSLYGPGALFPPAIQVFLQWSLIKSVKTKLRVISAPPQLLLLLLLLPQWPRKGKKKKKPMGTEKGSRSPDRGAKQEEERRSAHVNVARIHSESRKEERTTRLRLCLHNAAFGRVLLRVGPRPPRQTPKVRQRRREILCPWEPIHSNSLAKRQIVQLMCLRWAH